MNTPSHGSKVARKDIPAAFQWKIQDIYATQEEWEKACTALKELIAELETCKGSLKDASILLQALQLRDRMSQEIDKIYAYARLQQDADNGDVNAQALSGKAEGILAAFYNAVSFIDSEVTSLPKEQLEQLKNDPLFSDYSFYLEDLERMREHVLPGEQEAILAQSQLATGTGALAFRALVSADMEFPVIKDRNDNDAIVSEGCYMLNMSSDDRVLRKNSFFGLMNTYHHYRNTLAATLTGTCRSRYFYARVRGYQNSMEASLAEENIPVSLYNGLIQTIHAHLEPLHEYITLKKETLGYDEFHPYDLYVPLSQEGEKSFSCTFAEACETVKNALQPLGQAYIEALQKGMTEGWIDIYENKGKRSGAYSWGVYGIHPYVLLNFQPRYNSISTRPMNWVTLFTVSSAVRPSLMQKATTVSFALRSLPQPTKIFFWNMRLPRQIKHRKSFYLTSSSRRYVPPYTVRYNSRNLKNSFTIKSLSENLCKPKNWKNTGWKATGLIMGLT